MAKEIIRFHFILSYIFYLIYSYSIFSFRPFFLGVKYHNLKDAIIYWAG